MEGNGEYHLRNAEARAAARRAAVRILSRIAPGGELPETFALISQIVGEEIASIQPARVGNVSVRLSAGEAVSVAAALGEADGPHLDAMERDLREGLRRKFLLAIGVELPAKMAPPNAERLETLVR